MIRTEANETVESWVCGTCSSENAGWRLRCGHCGVLVRTSTSWGPPLPQPVPVVARKRRGGASRASNVVGCVAVGVLGVGVAGVGVLALQHAM